MGEWRGAWIVYIYRSIVIILNLFLTVNNLGKLGSSLMKKVNTGRCDKWLWKKLNFAARQEGQKTKFWCEYVHNILPHLQVSHPSNWQYDNRKIENKPEVSIFSTEFPQRNLVWRADPRGIYRHGRTAGWQETLYLKKMLLKFINKS